MSSPSQTAETAQENDAAPELLGIFPPHRVGALAGVSGYRVGQWARNRLIRPTLFEGRPSNLYAFFDVAEAIVVHWLLDKDFTYPQIHRAIDRAREDHPNWPLLSASIGVAQHAIEGDPRGLIVQEVDQGVWIETSREGDQVTIRPQLLHEAKVMLRSGGWLADRLGLKRIEVDPAKLGGAPTLKGRRWPVERVAQLAEDAEGKSILIDDYGLDSRDVDESLAWTAAAAKL